MGVGTLGEGGAYQNTEGWGKTKVHACYLTGLG